MLTLALLLACSDAPPAGTAWHWVDATGAQVSTGPDLPVIVDAAGLSWPLSLDGYFQPIQIRERWYASTDCTGRAYVPHPVHALQPMRFAWDVGAYAWLAEDGPEVSTSATVFGSRRTTSLTQPAQECATVTAALPGMVPVDLLTRGVVEAPDAVFLPPFHRVLRTP